MIWSKQFFLHIVDGSKVTSSRHHPTERKQGRTAECKHHSTRRHHSQFPKMGIPLVCGVYLAFQHCHPRSRRGHRSFAKSNSPCSPLIVYCQPNGQCSPLTRAFGDLNPPFHAWQRGVCPMDRQERRDSIPTIRRLGFLELVVSKLCSLFTWWVNRKDRMAATIFSGRSSALANLAYLTVARPPPAASSIRPTVH